MTTLAKRAEFCITEACRRFSSATGTPFGFHPCPEDEAEALQATWRSTHPDRWCERIDTDGEIVGLVFGDLGEARPDARSRVMELAELVSSLIAQVVSASTALASRTRELSTLVEIGRELPRQGDLVQSVRRLLRAAVDLTQFRAAAFFLFDAQSQRLQLRMLEHLDDLTVCEPRRRLSEATHDTAAMLGENVIITRESLSEPRRWLPNSIRTGVCLPITTEDGPVGTLWLYDRRERTPREREWHVLQSIAAQFTGVLERAVLRQESADQQRLRSELESVRGSQVFEVVQGRLRTSGFEVAAACTSRHEVGGDLCEVLPIDDDRALLVVGDACGDSVPAALVMSAVRGALRSVHGLRPTELPCPPEMLGLLNRVLCDVSAPHQFMSLFCGLLDTRNMMLTYSNAGHPGPLRVRGERFEELASHGMLLGVLPEAEYGHATIRLEPNDLLVAFTGGVTETVGRGKGTHLFRSRGIAGAVLTRVSQPVTEILAGIWDDVDRFSAGGEPDDRTLLVLRVGHPAQP